MRESTLLKVLKPGRPVGKTSNRLFLRFFSLKDRFMKIKKDPYESRSNFTVLRTVTGPLLTVLYFFLHLNLKKKKKTNEIDILDRTRIFRSDLAFCLKIFIENLPEALNLSSSRETSCSIEAESSRSCSLNWFLEEILLGSCLQTTQLLLPLCFFTASSFILHGLLSPTFSLK